MNFRHLQRCRCNPGDDRNQWRGSDRRQARRGAVKFQGRAPSLPGLSERIVEQAYLKNGRWEGFIIPLVAVVSASRKSTRSVLPLNDRGPRCESRIDSLLGDLPRRGDEPLLRRCLHKAQILLCHKSPDPLSHTGVARHLERSTAVYSDAQVP